MMLLLEPMVVMVYAMEMMMMMLIARLMMVEQQVDEIHDDRNRHNDDQRKENHYNALVGHDDVHAVDIEHSLLRKTVVAVVVVEVHCYYSKWAVFELPQTMNDDDEYQAKLIAMMVVAVVVVLLYFLLNGHYHSKTNVHNDQYVPMMKRFLNYDDGLFGRLDVVIPNGNGTCDGGAVLLLIVVLDD
jgi:hypothetical protein